MLCGNQLERHLQSALPELLSRSSTCYKAVPLAGTPLVNTVLGMEPRIAGTAPDVIKQIDARHFKGEIRRWDQFLDLVCILRGDDTTPAPLTDDEVNMVLRMMPTSSQRSLA